MTSFQSTIGDEEGIAEELAEGQREISIAEFFEKNKHMLGFDSGARGLVTAVKEAVDNALDATEEAGVLPDIYIEIEEVGDYYRLVIEDNGPGITKEQLPKVFGKLLYGSRFHAREQSRGQQGIGISAAVLYSQLTSGQPAKITSRPKGQSRAQYFELIIDTDTNEPEIRADEETTWDRPHGTRIELEMEANMRARGQLHDYVKHTAVVNPHARIELREPGLDEPMKFERATDDLPAETEEIRPHPHGVELGALIKMLAATESYSVSGFLQEEFTRVGKKTADGVIDNFRDVYYGRELAWSPPRAHDDRDVERAVADAVANKG
ncbi:DNA topoisomerase VI subunit B, partial [Halorubrum pallidum]